MSPPGRRGQRRAAPSARRHRPARPPRRVPKWVYISFGVVVLGALLWLGRDAVIARNALLDASDQARTLQQQITEGDAERAAATLADLQDSTRDARTHTDGPMWSVLEVLPLVGDSVDATRVVSESLDDISQEGLPPIVGVSKSLGSDLFKPKNGRFDIKRLQTIAPAVASASEVLTRNRADILAIDDEDLVGPIEGPITELKEKITDAQFGASSAARAMQLAPTMLGGDERRKYLLMFQNNAEVRSTGGLPGAFAIITADRGRITISRQGSSNDIRRFAQPVVDLNEEEDRIYGELMATDFRDVNFTPDFPRTAEIAREMIDRELGVKVDGVLSVDPVALQYLLKGTGPLEVADNTTLTTDNAVDILLNQVYARYRKPLVQDAFFADSAKRIFTAVVNGTGDARTSLKQLVKASEEHRILLWSAEVDEQKSLAETRVAGVLRGTEATRPHLGVYMNDSTESKMQYYLDAKTTAEAIRCSSDGVQAFRLKTTFRSTAPADAKNLPRYITGSGNRAPQGNMLLDTRFFGPADGEFTSFSVNGKSRPVTGLKFKGRAVNVGAFKLEPGETVRIEANVVTASNQAEDAVLDVTPGAHATKNGILVESAC